MIRVPVTGYLYEFHSYEVTVHGHSYRQTLLNTDTTKNLVQNVKYLEFVAKVTVISQVMLIVTVYVKITSHLHHVLYK